jgi:CRISPR-associated protein Csb2
LFQALVAGVARRGALDTEPGRSLEWLQSKPPIIIAPRSRPGQVVTRFVPNNDGDKEPDRQKRLTGKTSRPTIMLDRPEVHYIWALDRDCPQAGLMEASQSLSCLGWGIDMAYADSRLLDDLRIREIKGVRWFPKPGTVRDDGMLRVPKEESMADLRLAHKTFLERIEHGKPLRAVHKPQVFDRVFYASIERPIGRPYAVFDLRRADDERCCWPHARAVCVAGMIRHAAIKAMEYPPDGVGDVGAWVESFVAGHRPNGTENQERFSYVPLPSIGHEHADAMVRRVMITAPFGCEAQLSHLADQLDGVRLQPEGGGEGPFLERRGVDGVARRYLDASLGWASVTPVILPGHNDHKAAKTIGLIERALRQSGIDEPCEVTWSALPNFPHCLTAHKYDRSGRLVGYVRPKHLEGLTAVHVRLTFECAVAGPLSVGAGRHCGLGVLATMPPSAGG